MSNALLGSRGPAATTLGDVLGILRLSVPSSNFHSFVAKSLFLGSSKVHAFTGGRGPTVGTLSSRPLLSLDPPWPKRSTYVNILRTASM